MIDVVLGTVTTPTRRQLHLVDVEVFVRERRQRVVFVLPGSQRALEPLGVITHRVVFTEVSTTGFLTGSSTASNRQSQAQHLLRTVGVRQFSVGTELRLTRDVVRTLVEVFQFADGAFHIGAATENTDLGGHDILHASAQLGRVFRTVAIAEAIKLGLFALDEVIDDRSRDIDNVFRLFAEVSDVFANQHTSHNRFSHRVTTQAVETVHIPAGAFAGGEQALQLTAFARVVGADTTHRVVLSRTHRDPFLHRVNTQEVVADFIHFTEVVLNVVFAQQGDVQPDVFTEAALHTLALSDTFFHTTAHDVTGSQFFLFRFDVRHEAMAVNVTQQTAVTAAAFGHENTGRENTGRVELNGFHVAQRGNTGFQSQGVAGTFANHSVRGHAEQTTGTAGSDGRGLRHISHQFARDQITNNRTVAALAIMNQSDRFDTFHNRNVFSNNAVAHGVQHSMARAVRHEARTPLLRTAEVALADQAGSFLTFGNRNAFTVDDHLTITRGDTAPGHTPGSQFTHSLRGGLHEKTGDILVAAPVGTLNRVGKVDVFVIAQTFNHVTQRSLHTTLSGFRVRALGRHQRQDDGVLTAMLGSNCHAQTSQTSTNHQHVGVDDFHNYLVSLIQEGHRFRICSCIGRGLLKKVPLVRLNRCYRTARLGKPKRMLILSCLLI